MNKKLVAVAIAGLLAAPLAQAQTANVTLYGRLNLDFEWVNGAYINPYPGIVQPASCTVGHNAGTVNGCITTNPKQFRVSSNSSRFGLRGTESLGGGLNAIFQVESSLSPDSGTGTLAGRDSFVGLQGNWGTFRIGRFHAPYDNIHEIWGDNPTLLTSIMATSSLWAQGWTSKANGGFDDRVSNSVRWDSPVFSGFQLQFQYGNGPGSGTEGGSSTAAPNTGVWSGGIFYNNGPLVIGGAFQYNEQARGRNLNDYAWSIAASYQFPKVKVGVVYEKFDYDCWTLGQLSNCFNNAAGSPAFAGASKSDLKRNMVGVGVTWDLGPGQLYFDWAWAQEGKGSAVTTGCQNGTVACARVGGLAAGGDGGANQYEISYTYPLSKRTSVWVGWNKIANDSQASYNFGVNSYNVAIGGRPQGLAFGMWHNF
ncbi:MAG TPA: porin [Casimicrobiaceae bacterium]|nr:porin [Casimicrobiaceae bacterium]